MKHVCFIHMKNGFHSKSNCWAQDIIISLYITMNFSNCYTNSTYSFYNLKIFKNLL